MKHYCECGRKVVSKMRHTGDWRYVNDGHHHACWGCFIRAMEQRRAELLADQAGEEE